MLSTDMATTKKAPGKRPATKGPRKKSKLVLAGEERMREVLLKELRARRWSPSAVSDALDMGGSANVLRAIRNLELQEMYDNARTELGLKPGPQPDD